MKFRLPILVLVAIALTGCSDPGEEFVTVSRIKTYTSLTTDSPSTTTTVTKVVKVSAVQWTKNRDGGYSTSRVWSPASPEDAKKVQAYMDSK